MGVPLAANTMTFASITPEVTSIEVALCSNWLAGREGGETLKAHCNGLFFNFTKKQSNMRPVGVGWRGASSSGNFGMNESILNLPS